MNGLGIEFGLDRRAVCKRIADIDPAKTVNGVKLWRIADVAAALVDRIPAAPSDIDESERRRASAAATIAEITAAEKLGHVLDVRELDKLLSPTFEAMAARINGMPSKYGPIVCPDDPAEGRRVLEQVAQEVLTELRHVSFDDGATDRRSDGDSEGAEDRPNGGIAGVPPAHQAQPKRVGRPRKTAQPGR